MTHQDPTALPPAADAAALLEQAHTQWQTGDWNSLAKLQRDNVQHYPDRAQLVLMAAAAWLQIGNDAEARPFIHLAQNWGASEKRMGQVLIAGVYNRLGRASALYNQLPRARQHFEKAAAHGTPWSTLDAAQQVAPLLPPRGSALKCWPIPSSSKKSNWTPS